MNQTTLAYDVAGQGPAVILIHGGTVDRRMWDDQQSFLTRSFTVVRVDNAGHGASLLPDGEVSEVEGVRRVLDELGIERAHVVGLSAGAVIAVYFAVTYPGRLSSLVLTMGGMPGWEDAVWPAELDVGFEDMVAAAKAGDFDTARRLLLDLPPMRPSAAMPGVAARIEEMVRGFSWEPYTRDVTYEKLPPAGPRLHEIEVPVLIVQGALDIPAFRDSARLLARIVPRGEHVEIAGAGHMVNMERPDEYNRVVVEFLHRVDSLGSQASAAGTKAVERDATP